MGKVAAVVGSSVVFGTLTHCALLHFMCDLKATQMQCSLILGTYAIWVWTVPWCCENNQKTFVVKCSWSQNLEATLLFIDFSKAFDSTHRKRKDEADTSSIWSSQRNCYYDNNVLQKHKSNG